MTNPTPPKKGFLSIALRPSVLIPLFLYLTFVTIISTQALSPGTLMIDFGGIVEPFAVAINQQWGAGMATMQQVRSWLSFMLPSTALLVVVLLTFLYHFGWKSTLLNLLYCVLYYLLLVLWSLLSSLTGGTTVGMGLLVLLPLFGVGWKQWNQRLHLRHPENIYLSAIAAMLCAYGTTFILVTVWDVAAYQPWMEHYKYFPVYRILLGFFLIFPYNIAVLGTLYVSLLMGIFLAKGLPKTPHETTAPSSQSPLQ